MLTSILFIAFYNFFGNAFVDVAGAEVRNSAFNVDESALFHSQGTDAASILPYGALSNKCYMNLNVEWVVESESSVYGTPLVDDFHGYEGKHIMLTTFSETLEVIDQHGNRPAIGWPIEFNDRSEFHTSPFVYDIDNNGIGDFGSCSSEGIVRFMRITAGIHLAKYDIRVPKLKVLRDWYVRGDVGAMGGISKTLNLNSKIVYSLGRNTNTSKQPRVGSFHYFDDDDLDDQESDIEVKKKDVINSVLLNNGEHVLIDVNIMGSPLIAYNITGNQHDFLIIPLSYYFTDKRIEIFDEVKKAIPVDPKVRSKSESLFLEDFDPSNYVAGGIGMYDLQLRKWIWVEHLDLTTSKAKLKAYIYSSPTLADLDGDGHVEMIFGTSLGLLYALDPVTGKTKNGFPLEMEGAIESSIAIGNFVHSKDNGKLELFVVDGSGIASCFDHMGKLLWHRDVGGMSTATPAVGDIDGDRMLDIVFGTTTGYLWALKGSSGKVFKHFPFRTGKKIVSPVVLSNLKNASALANEDGKRRRSLHLIVPSLDGYLYIIDSLTGCTNKVDFSEHAYSMVLVDDINKDGYIDLILSTMNGNIYAIKTEGMYHPLRASQQVGLGKNHFTYRANYHGIFFTRETVELHEVLGQYVQVGFRIVDHRLQQMSRSYRVSIHVGSRSSSTGLKLLKTYDVPNRIYIESIDLQNIETRDVTVYIRMVNEHGELFFDTLNLKYYNVNLLHHNEDGRNSISFTIFVIFLTVQIYFTCLLSSLNESVEWKSKSS